MTSLAHAAEALLDTNVVVAALVDSHPHHAPSFSLLDDETRLFVVAAHSLAECFNTLTRRGGGMAYRWSPTDAWIGLRQVSAATRIVTLTSSQTLRAIRKYAEAGGVGPRLYDALIAEAAARAGLPRLITWNVAHMQSVAPHLDVVTPVQAVG